MKKYSDLKIIQGIKKQDSKILQYLYDEYFTLVLSIVEENNGTVDEARDLFQESIILIYRKIKNDSFQLTSSFKTYLYSISWNLWMKEIRSRDIESNNVESYIYLEHREEENIDELKQHMKYKIFQKYYRKLPKDCQKILRMFYKGKSYEKIAEKIGLNSEKSVRNRKYNCKEMLVSWIKNDKRYKNTFSEDE